MSGTSILRRDSASNAVSRDASLSASEKRKQAFEANLALQLEKSLGGYASLSDIDAVTQTLSSAYAKLEHATDARTTLWFKVKRYVVLQFGWAQRTGDSRLDALDPFASKLISSLPPHEMEMIEPWIRPIGVALSNTEISRRHPFDVRLRLNTPWVRFYLNFLSGKDKRHQQLSVTHERRKPTNEGVGLIVLMAIAVVLSLLGLGMIVSTLWALSELLMSQMGRDTLAALFDRSLVSLSTILAGFGLLRGF